MDTSKSEKIFGWMLPSELDWLAEQAQFYHTIVEIGCWRGRSTSALAQYTPGVVYAIDDFIGPRDTAVETKSPGENRNIFERNLSEFKNKVVTVIADHSNIPDNIPSPDMVFLDGSHEYEDIKRDIDYWFERLQPNGLICGHDFNWPGVYKAVMDKFFFRMGAPGTAIWYYIK